MKKILTAILLICVAVTSGYAQTDSVAPVKEEAATQAQPQPQAQPKETTAATVSGNELVQRGDSAYTADNFALAEQLYTAAMKESGTSSTLFYNVGNAYYRQGNLGKAIVNYERALKLDPTNGDARANLEFVKTKITDRQIDSGSIMEKLRDGIVEYFHADTWAWITVVLFALFLAGVATYLFSSVIMVKKISFFGGIIVFLLCVCCVIISFAAANRVETDKWAIILPPSAQLSTTPREARTQSEEAFLLHEGTKVEIVDSVSDGNEGKWYEVKVGHGERAWIKASEIERI